MTEKKWWGASMTLTEEPAEQPSAQQRRRETIAFVLLALVLFPILSVVIVGGFGFLVWMQQLLLGPPGV